MKCHTESTKEIDFYLLFNKCTIIDVSTHTYIRLHQWEIISRDLNIRNTTVINL